MRDTYEPSASEPFAVTFVHGTWATDTAWIEEDAPVSRALEAAFGDRAILVPPQRWSGRNRHEARTRAGAQLAEHIRRVAELRPGTKQLLIAHSHGGTVVTYAMRDTRARAAVCGIVTIATPFIWFYEA